jgi:predicted negative regulator of RcsB-dependent stress response
MSRIIKRRIKKKDVGVENEVQEKISDIRNLMQKKQKAVITYSSAAAVVVIAIVGLLFYRYTNEEKSRQLEHEAYKIYYNEFQKTPLPRKEQFEKAADLFKQAYDKHKSPRVLLYMAQCYHDGGKDAEALTALNLFLKNHASDKSELPIAYRQLAGVQLAMGNRAEALKTFDALYNTDGHIFKDLALIESARILEADGKKEEALAKYKELTEKYKTSPFMDEAKAKIGSTEKKEG